MEYRVWAPLFIVPWYMAGVAASIVVMIVTRLTITPTRKPRQNGQPGSEARMWTRYDPVIDKAYILLADAHPGEAAIKLVDVAPAQTDPLAPPIQAALERLTLEFDSDGRLIGVEIEEAGRVLPKGFLEKAAQKRRPRPRTSK